MPAGIRCCDETALALAELDGDRRFAALSAADKAARLAEALAFADRLADETAGAHGRPEDETDLHAIAARLKVKVVSVSERNPYYPVLAEHSQRPRRIRLHDGTIRETEAKLRALTPDFFSRFDLRALCLCHELFHDLEKNALGDTGRIIHIETRRLGWFRTRHYVARASEVASHEFVKRLLGLSYSPIVFKPLLAGTQGHSIPAVEDEPS